MADTDLFMECEEEELEPWQMIEDDVVDDTGGGMLLAATNNLSAGIKSGVAPVSVGDLQNNEVEKKTMLAVLSPNSNVGGSLVNSSGQPLIVAQNPAGLGPHMTMPPIYSPTAMQVLQESKPGATSNVSGQPIFITTQGFTMKDLRSVQNPVGIVLNVQGGQGTVPYQTKPLTLVPGMWSSAPATTQFVKSAVGVPQLWSPVTSIRPATNTFPGSVTTVIPATVTIRSTVPPVAQKPPAQTSPTQSHLQPKCLTQALASLPPSQSPHSHIQPPAQARPQAHPHCQPSILHHPHALQLPNHDHKLVNFLQNTNLIRLKATEPASAEVRTKPEELLKSSVPPPVQITNTTTSTAAASPQITHKNTLNHTTPFKLPENNMNNGVPIPMDCPKCNIHFNILESLKVHMAYCCPQLLNPPTPAKAPQQQPHQAPPPPPPPAPPPTPPAVQQQPSVKLAEPSQGKLIMLVDDFYYGRDEGSTYQMLQEMKSSTTFRCLSCLKRLKNNIRFMNHMKHHLELEQQNDDTIENHTTCHHCFRQYATPFQLQCHIENVHSPYETTTKCKICELAFETEQLFLQHMKDTHKPGEMPYVCQVCEYRSSVYLEVDSHFRMIHEDTKNLLCPYCFKVVKNSSAYQQHYMKHQKKSVYPCNKCRLQFISAKEKMEHKVEHHKTFKKPKQLEGLQPGTKVTIRTSMGQARAAGGPVQEIPARKVYPPVLPPKPQEAPACSTVHKVAPAAPKPAPKAEKRKAVERISPLLMDMQEIRRAYGNQVCLECNIDITNVSCISNHFPTYVHCSRCRYSTSCSRAYADHMISYHTQRGKPKYLMFGKVKKSAVLLVCTSCTFAVETGDGDEMAQHLDQNPGHGPCCFVTFAVGERRGRSARVTEEEAPASEPRPSTPDFEIEEEESVGVQDSSAEREANDDSPGPPADEIQKPVAKSQQVKTVRLSTVCSTNYINAKISSRPPVAASPPPAPSKDAEASSPIYVEGEKSSSGAIYIAEDKNGSSPEYVAEDKIGSSPTYVAEDENDSSLVCVQEGKRRLTPDCVDEERSLTPECVEEERSSTPGCVEEDQRSLTPECVEEERSSTPGFVEERSSTPGFVEERSSTPGFVEERSLTPECVDEERSLTPECVEERSLSPGFVEERSLTPECVDEERSLTPECVDEETSLNPECAEEERSLTPGCVEEDKRRLTPEGNEVKRRLSPVSAEEDSQLSKGGDDSESQPKDVPWTRKPLSEHEFRVVLHALCCGMQAATERYGASRSQVEHLLNECAQQLDLSSGAEAGSRLLSPEAEEQLVEWVLVQRERQLPLTEETFLHRLSKLLGPRGAEPAAPSSCLWAVGFLLRHNLIAYAKITVARKLPREMEESVQSFVEFAQQQIVGRDFPYCMIGNMDEIPIFLDPEALRRPEGTPGGLEVAGTGEPQFVIVFTILADGNLLPTMIFSRGGLPPWLKVPAGILLEVKEAGYSEAEVLELWLAKVWRRHMATRYRRTMLVLDSSRRHLSDDFIDHLSRCNSLPLVVPGGCTSRAQPLDMCIGQTLRSFLQKRWAEYSREAACFRDVYGDVLQSLLNWVAEVAGFVASNADVVQQSFLLASVLPGPGGRPASVQQKVEAQEELVSFLQEQLELSGKLEEYGDGKAPPTLALDPRLLTRLFEADSEAESFYGFSEGDL